jgi:L-amino acid N-acyltransferase YncA
MIARPANRADAAAIARIYNQGIEDRTSTFETRLRTVREIEDWFDRKHPILVVEDEAVVIAFAGTSQYRPRDCYSGIAEFSVYVDRDHRGKSAGTVAMRALIESASAAGFWKLVSRVFPDNIASLRLLRSLGFREVGTYERHGQLDGVWRDVVIVERLLNGAIHRRVADANGPQRG